MIKEEDNIECLQHLMLQLRDCEEDGIREELKSKSWKPMYKLNYSSKPISEPILYVRQIKYNNNTKGKT